MTKRTKAKDEGVFRPFLTGLLVATIAFFGFMLLTTLLLYFSSDPTYKSELWSFGAMLLSGAVAGFINAKKCGEGGVLVASLSSLLLVLIIFLVGVISSGLPSLPSVINYHLYTGISVVSAYFASRQPKKRRRR